MTTAFIEFLAVLPAALWILTIAAQARRGRAAVAVAWPVVVAVAISFVLAHVNRWFDLWKAHPYFPSGHETFAACMATALVYADRRWAVPMLALLALLGSMLVRAGWHGRMEVVAGALLGIVVAAAVLQVMWRSSRTT